MSAGKPPRRKHPLTIAEVRALDRGEVLPSADRRYGTPTGRSARSSSPTPYRAASPTPYRAASPTPYRSASPDPYYRQGVEEADWAAYNEFAQREAALGRHVPDFTTFRQMYGNAPVSAPADYDVAVPKEHKESFFQRIFKGKEKRPYEEIPSSGATPARPPPVAFTPRSTTPTPSQRFAAESPSHRNYEPPRAARDSVKPEAYYGRAPSPLPAGFTPLNQNYPAQQLPQFEPVQFAPQQPVYTYMDSPRAPIQPAPQFTPLHPGNFMYSEPVFHQELPPVVMPPPQLPLQQEIQMPIHVPQPFQQEIHLQPQFQQIPLQVQHQMQQQIQQELQQHMQQQMQQEMQQQMQQQLFPMVYPQQPIVVEQPQQVLQQPIVVESAPQMNFVDFGAQLQQQPVFVNGPNVQQSPFIQQAGAPMEYMFAQNPQVQIIPEFMATGGAYGAPLVASGHHLTPGTPISGTPRSATPTNPPIGFDPVTGLPYITNLGGAAQFVFDTNAARVPGHGLSTTFSVRPGAETGSLRTQSSNNSWKGSQHSEQPQAAGEEYRRYNADRESPGNGLPTMYQDPKDENEKLREEAARAVERVEELQEQLARANGEIERLRHRDQQAPGTQRPPSK